MGALFLECPVADTLELKPIVALAVREAYHAANLRRRYLKKRKAEGTLVGYEEAELLDVWSGQSLLSYSKKYMRRHKYLPAEALLAMLQRDGSYVSMYKVVEYEDDKDMSKCGTLRLTVKSSGFGKGAGDFCPAYDVTAYGGDYQMDGTCVLFIEFKTLRLEDPYPNSLWSEEHLDDEDEEPPENHYWLHAVPPGLRVDPAGKVTKMKTKAGDIMVGCEFGEHDGTFEWLMRHVPPAA